MKNIEFFTLDGEVFYRESGGQTTPFTEESKEVIGALYDRVVTFHPKALERLKERFARINYRPNYQRYRMMARFCRCNFGNADTSPMDIDATGCFRFEHVACPLRGECPDENVICHPEFNSTLSPAELRVLEPLFYGKSIEEIAETLIISEHTVRNHKRNAFAKLNIHTSAELMDYAHRNNLFKE